MIERPDLSQVDPAIRAYIQTLEAELDYYKGKEKPLSEIEPEAPQEAEEPPTTINLVVMTAQGLIKRTPRHHYQHQRRGGMGIFDLDAPKEDAPHILALADEKQTLLVFTNLARVFRLPISQISESPIRARGQSLATRLGLQPDEHLVAALPDLARGAVTLASERGMVRTLRHHVFGEYMRPGTALFNPNQLGQLVTACLTPGDGDLLIATRRGKAIRFSEKLVPPQGGPGIRLEEGDDVVAIAAVYDDSLVFVVDDQGKGTIRQMASFNPNKSSGGGGKIIMNSDSLTAALTVQPDADLFMISQLSKLIRFKMNEVPVKDSNVQGVICMNLRADLVTAVTVTQP